MTRVSTLTTSTAVLTPAEAVALLAREVCVVGVERVQAERALGRVLAEAAVTDRPSPAADVSAMDGYALRVDDLASGTIDLSGECVIGQAPVALPSGRAMKIVTGACVPLGADAVIKREDTIEASSEIRLRDGARIPSAGQFIRRCGENAPAGQTVIDAGSRVTPAIAGALASFGYSQVIVRKRARVAIISTGDELVQHGETPRAWQLRDSNGPALVAMLDGRCDIDIVESAQVSDDQRALEHAIARCIENADVVITSGGVSMGDRDCVPEVVKRLGGRVLFHRLPQRPGKPLFAAILADGRPIIGLPGNPVSVLVTGRRFVVPTLDIMSGAARQAPDHMVELACVGPPSLPDLWWHRLVTITSGGVAHATDARSSGDVVSAARADGFVEVPPGAAGRGPWKYFAWGSNS